MHPLPTARLNLALRRLRRLVGWHQARRRKQKDPMSEFRFLCPECGQKILGDTAYSGTQIACPTCQKTITIPAAASAAPAPVSHQPRPRQSRNRHRGPHHRSPAAATSQQQTPGRFSGLAVASLICSVFVPLGSIPGIICGHLAKARMRRNIFLAGEKMANAGLLISYCVLMATLAVAGNLLPGTLAFQPGEGDARVAGSHRGHAAADCG